MDASKVQHDLEWLYNGIGRVSALVEMGAPESVVLNERRLWDEKMANVRDAVASDAVDMDGAWDAWRECLEEYARMPTAWELSEATEGNGRG